MHKIYLSAVVLFALNIANAKANTARDSIGVENNKGKKLIVHQTVAKDTYYSIGRRYNVSPKEIMTFNDNKYLQVGVIVKVPTNIPFTATGSANSTQNQSASTGNIIEHTIKPKENLNMLAEKYGTTINEIKALNNLSSSNLSIGQVLKIPAKNTEQTSATAPVTAPAKNNNETATANTQSADQTIIEHTVQPKEFLGKIAEKYSTTVEEVKKANNLSGNNLRIGQKLKIPATKNIDENKVAAAEEKPVQENKSTDAAGTHTVLRNETIFTIAKQYGITAYQIRKLNDLPDNAITIGQVLKVPGGIITDVQVPKEKQAEAKVKEVEAKEAPATKEESFIHTVTTGENIFTIAKKYNLTAYQIRTANKLEDNAIKVDQKLIIPKPPQPKSVNDLSKEEQENEPDSTMVKDPKLRRDPSVYGLSQIEEKGTAVWIADQDLDGTKMLVLHRTAPVGRVIKITNPMTNRTTFAKVVGKFTENESTKDVIIVMTKAVADSLGALDKRFFCNLTYSAQ